MLSRRQMLLGLGFGLLAACAPKTSGKRASGGDDGTLPPPVGDLPDVTPVTYADNVDALFDVLIPTERDDAGNVISPGAREAKADDVIAIDRFATLATALGFLPPLSDAVMSTLSEASGALRVALNANLDALSLLEKPLTPFRELPRSLQESVVTRAFDNEAMKPAMLVVRAACFIAWLGAVTNDLGLQAVGFPAAESFDDGLMVSAYPTKDGGEDYTFNEMPPPTHGEDLATMLDANGDLL